MKKKIQTIVRKCGNEMSARLHLEGISRSEINVKFTNWRESRKNSRNMKNMEYENEEKKSRFEHSRISSRIRLENGEDKRK